MSLSQEESFIFNVCLRKSYFYTIHNRLTDSMNCDKCNTVIFTGLDIRAGCNQWKFCTRCNTWGYLNAHGRNF